MRPAVAGDGGDIVFRGYRDGIVRLHMQGACSGCPSSRATLKHGIENMLRHYVPEVVAVEQVDILIAGHAARRAGVFMLPGIRDRHRDDAP